MSIHESFPTEIVSLGNPCMIRHQTRPTILFSHLLTTQGARALTLWILTPRGIYHIPHFRIYEDDVIKWKYFPCRWPFMRVIHWSPHKDQWRGALMFSLICPWMNDWVNNRESGHLRRHRAHYDTTLMCHTSTRSTARFCYTTRQVSVK